MKALPLLLLSLLCPGVWAQGSVRAFPAHSAKVPHHRFQGSARDFVEQCLARVRLAEENPPPRYFVVSVMDDLIVDHDPDFVNKYVNEALRALFRENAEKWIKDSGYLKNISKENTRHFTIWVDKNQDRCWIITLRPGDSKAYGVEAYFKNPGVYLSYWPSGNPDLSEIKIDSWNGDHYPDENIGTAKSLLSDLKFVQWMVEARGKGFSFDPGKGVLRLHWEEKPGTPPLPPLFIQEPLSYAEIGGSVFVELKALHIDDKGKADHFRFISKFFDANGRILSRTQYDGIGSTFLAQAYLDETFYPGEGIVRNIINDQFQVIPSFPYDSEEIFHILEGKIVSDIRNPLQPLRYPFRGIHSLRPSPSSSESE